jgi:anti-anti-sigma factor
LGDGTFWAKARRVGDAAHVVCVSGELDLATSRRLRALLAGVLADEPETVVLDLSAATLIDSTSLLLLAGARNHLRAGGGRMLVVCPNPNLAKLFVLARAWDDDELHDSLGHAIELLSRPLVPA